MLKPCLLLLLLVAPAWANNPLQEEERKREELVQRLERIKQDIASLPELTRNLEAKEAQLKALLQRRDKLRKKKKP